MNYKEWIINCILSFAFNPRPEFIYFVQGTAGGPIKIGCTKRPHQGLASLQTANPYPLAMLTYFPGSKAVKATLHAIFQKHKHHGEWFCASKELLEFVEVAKKLFQSWYGGSWAMTPTPIDELTVALNNAA